MIVAFKEFAAITQSTISEQRAKHKDAVLDNIESFAKRTSIRNLGPDSKRLSVEDLGFLYDRFYGILYEREQRMQLLREESTKRAKSGRTQAPETVSGNAGNPSIEIGRVGMGPSPTLMNYDGFREFLAAGQSQTLQPPHTKSRCLRKRTVSVAAVDLAVSRFHHGVPGIRNLPTTTSCSVYMGDGMLTIRTD